mmetsp:Transcript_9262/g.56401  ORF Transcript_9262/g.56401 Transcript_9262/m.56401 type:complete len:222 (+) Transcript_9262:1830-2495(+)
MQCGLHGFNLFLWCEHQDFYPISHGKGLLQVFLSRWIAVHRNENGGGLLLDELLNCFFIFCISFKRNETIIKSLEDVHRRHFFLAFWQQGCIMRVEKAQIVAQCICHFSKHSKLIGAILEGTNYHDIVRLDLGSHIFCRRHQDRSRPSLLRDILDNSSSVSWSLVLNGLLPFFEDFQGRESSDAIFACNRFVLLVGGIKLGEVQRGIKCFELCGCFLVLRC